VNNAGWEVQIRLPTVYHIEPECLSIKRESFPLVLAVIAIFLTLFIEF